MKKQKNKIIFLWLCLSFLTNACFSLPDGHALDDAIIAVVNEELITLKDLHNYIHAMYVNFVAEGLKEEELKEIMKQLENKGIDQLIEDKLILSKANQTGLEVRPALIDSRLEKIRSNYPSEQAFVNDLTKNGLTISDLRNKFLDQLKVKYIVEHEVKSKIHVNPQEVTNYYEQHKNEFQKNERLRLDSIYILFNSDQKSAMEKAREIMELLKQGKDFREMASQYSQAPSVGIIERGQILPKIEESVFKLTPGEISQPIETENGIYIFKLLEKIPLEILTLKEVKDVIYQKVFDQKFEQEFTQWINQLKAEAYIEIKG